MIPNAIASSVLNVLILAGLPFLVYYVYHRTRHGRRFTEIARRAGLQLGEPRHLVYGAAVAFVSVIILVVRPPSMEPFTREGSAQRSFVGLGVDATSVALALLYGVVKTGFAEELLFRGLIAGSLSRRMPLGWANVTQALIFLLPHLIVLRIMPEMWAILPVVFAGGLFAGWLRIRSGSIVGAWLLHASVNVTMALGVASRTTA